MSGMKVFYWVMAVLIVGTFLPSVFYLLLYAVTGEDACAKRARAMWWWGFGKFGFDDRH
jgi:hypothetical protein